MPQKGIAQRCEKTIQERSNHLPPFLDWVYMCRQCFANAAGLEGKRNSMAVAAT